MQWIWDLNPWGGRDQIGTVSAAVVLSDLTAMFIRATRSEDLSIGPNQCDTNEQGESFQYGNISYLYILQILGKHNK